MGVLLTRDNLKGAYIPGITVRDQRCMGCNTILATEIGARLDQQAGCDYYVIKDAPVICGEYIPFYKKCRGNWFGQPVRCPVCGREGKLPMDKPLNWDTMQLKGQVTDPCRA